LVLSMRFFRPAVPGSGGIRFDRTVPSELATLFCCCADHSQLSCIIK
jgi:hypothetical protein